MRAARTLESRTSVTAVTTASTVLDGQTYSFLPPHHERGTQLVEGGRRQGRRGRPGAHRSLRLGSRVDSTIGEFATVFQVDGTTVDLVSTLIDSYQTKR